MKKNKSTLDELGSPRGKEGKALKEHMAKIRKMQELEQMRRKMNNS